MNDRAADRREQQRAILAARGKGLPLREGLPPPPYQVHGVNMLYLLCVFDRSRAAELLPTSLEASDSGAGVFGIYEAPFGWGIAPFTALYVGIEVKGFDSPDGTPGMFLIHGSYSNVAGEIFSANYNANFAIGHARLRQQGDSILGEAFDSANRPLIRLAAREVPGTGTEISGINRYLGLDDRGRVTSWTVAFNAPYDVVEVSEVSILEGAGDNLRRLVPIGYVVPGMIRGMSMTFSPPRLASEDETIVAEDTRATNLLALFGRMGRAAAILDANGSVVRTNARCETLMTSGLLDRGTSLFASKAGGEWRALRRALDITPGNLVSELVAVAAADGATRLLLQAVVLDPAVVGAGNRLVFVDVPGAATDRDPLPALRLLGLTPAEARIAAVVGAGVSPKEASQTLEITESTVRSALKLIYDKLGIGRQSELAKIVTQLEAQGID